MEAQHAGDSTPEEADVTFADQPEPRNSLYRKLDDRRATIDAADNAVFMAGGAESSADTGFHHSKLVEVEQAGQQEGQQMPAPTSALHFNMAADESEEVGSSTPSSSWLSSSSDRPGFNSASSAASKSEELASSVRASLSFLSVDDQKTVCRRQCHLARTEEEAAMRQLKRTIDQYMNALEVSRAVSQADPGSAENADILSKELRSKYEERVQFLRDLGTTLSTTHTLSLPQLTVLEQAKGLAFSSYAQVASQLKPRDGASNPFNSLTALFRNQASSSASHS